MQKLYVENEKYKLGIIIVLLAISLIFTYVFHFGLGEGIIFTHFFYVPIILAAIWWQRKGLIVPIFLSAALISSHLLSVKLDYPIYEDLFRAFMFMAVGVVVVLLSEQIAAAEDKLRASEERFRSVSQSAVDGIITTNSQGDIVIFNDSLQKIFGYHHQELEGKPVIMLMPERYRQNFKKTLEELQATGKHQLAGKIFESMGLMKEGTEFPMELSLATWTSKGEIFTTSIIRDVSERKIAEERLEKSLKEKEFLLKEIHHRVKNNLMIISSLLSIQSRYIKDPDSRKIFEESGNRARSMALIHEKLYQSTDIKRIDFGEYIRTLGNELYRTYAINPQLVKLELAADDMTLDINIAIPLGLIFNELITNSLKHAFPDNRSGEIKIGFHKDDDTFTLSVSDDGVGLPDTIDFKNSESMGLQLVNMLTQQIDGQILLDTTSGTSYTLTFSEDEI